MIKSNEFTKAIERVFEEIDKQAEDLVYTTQQLIRIPSVTGEESEAQKFMATQFEKIGLVVDKFEADRNQLKDHPGYVEGPTTYNGRPNVVGILEGASEFSSLIINGHIDVVSPEPLDQWTVDPWGGEIIDGRLYGRGSVDMKSGLMANHFALKCIIDSGLKPEGKLICQSVIEEEAGGIGGTLACFAKGYLADGMIVSEPTNLMLAMSHPGVKYFRIISEGKSIHAASSHQGVNAIGKMNKIYDALVQLDEIRADRNHYPLVEKLTGRSCNLSIGVYTAGDWPSTVAGQAVIEGRVGFVPGESGKDIIKEIERTISHTAQKDPWLKAHPPEVKWFGYDAEPWLQDENHTFVQSFRESATPVVGQKIEAIGIPAAMDTRFAAYHDIPTLAFGCKGGPWHGIDEHVEIESLKTVTKVIAKFILDFCGFE